MSKRIILPLVTLTMTLGLGLFMGKSLYQDKEPMLYTKVKNYKLSPSRAKEAEKVLQSFFTDIDRASAKAFGTGQLIVSFPSHFEKSIDELLNEFTEDNRNLQKRIRLDYWLVRGTKEKLKSPSDISVVSKAIDSIVEVDGEQNFEILEHLSTNAVSGNKQRVRGWITNAESLVTAIEDDINLLVNFRSDFGVVDLDTKINDKEFLVLGQSAVSPDRLNHALTGRLKTGDVKAVSHIYYIVKAQIL